MARIKGIDIPNDKRIEISLTYIYGIGRNLSKKILTAANIDLDKKAGDLTTEEEAANVVEIQYARGCGKVANQIVGAHVTY